MEENLVKLNEAVNKVIDNILSVLYLLIFVFIILYSKLKMSIISTNHTYIIGINIKINLLIIK